MDRLLEPRTAFALLLAASVAILGAALASQYLGGLDPCVLCLWQRYPYAVVIGLAGVGLGLAAVSGMPRAMLAGLAGAAALAFLANAGIAGFHVGVEQHWWEGTQGCAAAGGPAGSVEELRRRLLATEVARCDEVAFSLLGISMAGYNLIASVILGAFAAGAARVMLRGARTAGARHG
jgi:disulfide bond formation protein DsbB